MTTLAVEGAGLPSGAEGFSAGVLGTPNRVATTLHLAIGSLDRTGAMDGIGEGAVEEDVGLAWRHVDDERQMLRVDPSADSGPAIRFHSGRDQDKPALEIDGDGAWQMGEAAGEVDTLGELLDVGDPTVRVEALALLGTADAVLERSRTSTPLPGSTS